MKAIADSVWRVMVTLILLVLMFHPPASPQDALKNLAESQSLLAQSVLDILDIIGTLKDRIEALEKSEMQKKKIENLPNRKVEPNAMRLYVAETPH